MVKEEQGIPFSTTKIPLMWTPHSNNTKHANVGQTRKHGKRRGKELDAKGSTKVYGNVGHKQIYIILFNNLNLTTHDFQSTITYLNGLKLHF